MIERRWPLRSPLTLLVAMLFLMSTGTLAQQLQPLAEDQPSVASPTEAAVGAAAEVETDAPAETLDVAPSDAPVALPPETAADTQTAIDVISTTQTTVDAPSADAAVSAPETAADAPSADPVISASETAADTQTAIDIIPTTQTSVDAPSADAVVSATETATDAPSADAVVSASETATDAPSAIPLDGPIETVAEAPTEPEIEALFAINDKATLSRFTAAPSPLRLINASNDVDLFVPLSGTVALLDATLKLNYHNSIALLAERSILSVRLNDTTVAQVQLRPETPKGTATISLPSELWTPGFNKLTLSITQHYADRCGDPAAPELWTEIDISTSELSMTYRYPDIDYKISDLSQLVSPGFGGFANVRVLTAAGAAPEMMERAAPLAVQALALRRGYLPLSVETGDLSLLDPPDTPTRLTSIVSQIEQRENGLTVLVGTIDELAAQLQPEEKERVTGPSLLVRGTEGAAQLVITGRNPDEVVNAARKLALVDDNLNPGNYATFSLDDAGPLMGLGARRELRADKAYTFAELGVDTQTVGGRGRSEVVIPLSVPSDFYTAEGAEGELLLNFSYTAGMAQGSIFDASVNGEFIHGLSLDAANGIAFRNYRIVVPGRLLRPGANEVSLEFNLRPYLLGGECLYGDVEYVGAQIIGDSQFRMPPGGSAAILPDLSLLSQDGVPFGDRDLSEGPIEVYVTAPSLYGAALTLIGKIAQAASVVEPEVQLMTGIPEATVNNAFIIAPQREIPAQLFGEWPVVVGETSRWPYSALEDFSNVGVESPNFAIDQILQTLLRDAPEENSPNDDRLTTFRQQGDLGDLGIFASFRNPWSEAYRTIALLSAADDETLVARVDTLVDPGVWGQIRGDFVSWNAAEQVFATFVSQPEVVAPDDFWLRVRIILSQSPQLWLIGAAGALLLFLISASFLIRRRIRRFAQSS